MASPITITTDELKTQHAWLERAQKAGLITSDLQPSIDDPNQLRRIVQYIKRSAPSALLPGPSYDASSILNFGQPMQGTLPQAEPGEVVIWYGSWSLQQLRDNSFIRERNVMHNQDWYNKYDWSTEVLPVGFYRLQIPVPNSSQKTFEEQTALLTGTEQVAHPVLVATAELCHYLKTGERLLKNIWVRTSKQNRDGFRVELGWADARLDVDNRWDGCRNDFTCLACARDCT